VQDLAGIRRTGRIFRSARCNLDHLLGCNHCQHQAETHHTGGGCRCVLDLPNPNSFCAVAPL